MTKFLNLRTVRGETNEMWIGQVSQIPGILVQSNSEEGLIQEAAKSVCLYIKQFPDDIFQIVPSKIEVK